MEGHGAEQARPLTHVRLEDCFGEEHVVDIRTLPNGVRQAVQQQVEQTFGIKQVPLNPTKEPGTTGTRRLLLHHHARHCSRAAP